MGFAPRRPPHMEVEAQVAAQRAKLQAERIKYSHIIPRFDTMTTLPPSWRRYVDNMDFTARDRFPGTTEERHAQIRAVGEQHAYDLILEMLELSFGTESRRKAHNYVASPRSLILYRYMSLMGDGSYTGQADASVYYEGMKGYFEGCMDLHIPIAVLPEYVRDTDNPLPPAEILARMQQHSLVDERPHDFWVHMQQQSLEDYWKPLYNEAMYTAERAQYNFATMMRRFTDLTRYLEMNHHLRRLKLDLSGTIVLSLKHNPHMFSWVCRPNEDKTEMQFIDTDDTPIVNTTDDLTYWAAASDWLPFPFDLLAKIKGH